MNELYRRLGLYHPVLSNIEQFTDIPSGSFDLQRLIDSLPAFKAMSDAETPFCKKKLLLKDISPDESDEPIYKLKFLMWLRQLMEDEFELYQFRDGIPERLTRWTVSMCFDYKTTISDSDAHDAMMHPTGLGYSEIAIFNRRLYQELSQDTRLQPQTLWDIDLRYSRIERHILKESTNHNLFTTYIVSIIDGHKDDIVDEFIPYLKNTTGKEIQVKEIFVFASNDALQHRFEEQQIEPNQLEYLRIESRGISVDVFRRVTQNAASLRHLNLYDAYPDIFLIPFPHLEEISFHDVFISEQLQQLQHNAKNLRKLMVSDWQILDHEWPNLQTLELQTQNGIPSDALSKLVTFFKKAPAIQKIKYHLSEMNFQGIADNNAVNETIMHVLLEGNRALEVLRLKSPELFFKVIQDHRLYFVRLEEIDFGDQELSVEQLCMLIENAPHLNELQYKRMDFLNLKGKTLSKRVARFFVNNLNHYTKVAFGIGQLSPDIVQGIRQHAPNCIEIEIDDPAVGLDVITGLMWYLPNVQEVCFAQTTLDLDVLDHVRNPEYYLNYLENKNMARILLRSNSRQLHTLLTAKDNQFTGKHNLFTAKDNQLNDLDFPELRALHVRSMNESQLFSYLSRAPQIRELSITGISTRWDLISPTVSPTLPHLSRLRMSLSQFKAPALRTFLNNHASSLTYLKIDITENPEEYFFNKDLLIYLEHLEISSGIYILNYDRFLEYHEYWDFFTFLSHFSSARLTISNIIVQKPRNEVSPFKNAFFLSALDRLTHLEIKEVLQIFASDLLQLIQNAPNLTQINIRNTAIMSNDEDRIMLNHVFATFQTGGKCCTANNIMWRPTSPEHTTEHATNLLGQQSMFPNNQSHAHKNGVAGGGAASHGPSTFTELPSAPAKQKTIDADTGSKGGTFNLNRLFYQIGKNHAHPEPRDYRLSTYHNVLVTEEPCNIQSAFQLQHLENLPLTPVKTIQFCQEDVYRHGESWQQTKPAHCYYAKTQLRLSDDWRPLPSLFMHEIITHMHVDDNVGVEVKYCLQDHLYYIRKNHGGSQNVAIDYLIQIKPSDHVPAYSSDLQRLIEYCKLFSEGALIDLPVSPTGKDFLMALALQQKGVCRHRTLVFKALLENPDWRNEIPVLHGLNLEGVNARIIENDCHSFLEIRENNQWTRCDLGGYPAKLNIDEKNNPFSQPSNLQSLQRIELTTGTTHREAEIILQQAKTITELTLPPDVPLPMVLAIPNLKQLKALNLPDRTLAPDEINDLLTKAPYLQTLTFAGCTLANNMSYITPHIEPQTITPLPEQHYFRANSVSPMTEPLVYTQLLIAREEPKRLIECTPAQLLGLNHALQDYCKHTAHDVYVIYSAEVLRLNRPYVALQDDDTGVIRTGYHGALYEFLRRDSARRTLMVDFSNFTASERVRYNSLLDDVPTIDGHPLPKGTKVIGLIHPEAYKDASIYSRFGLAVETCPIAEHLLPLPPVFQVNPSADEQRNALAIDCYGMSNWKAVLLGAWSLQEQSLQFLPSPLLQLLRREEHIETLILNNPPYDPEFERFFREAEVREYIEYAGKRFNWPTPKLYITHQLQFATRNIIGVENNRPSMQAEIINPSKFTHFLKRYMFQHDCLIEQDGILAAHATLHPERPLILYVSDCLSKAQWSMLLAECSRLNIQLLIHLAPGVTLPDPLTPTAPLPNGRGSDLELQQGSKLQPESEPRPLGSGAVSGGGAAAGGGADAGDGAVVSSAFSSIRIPLSDCCIASTDPDLTLAQCESLQDKIFIDLSELNSSDLFTKVRGGVDEKRLKLEFSEETGALLKGLKTGTVILHGKCSSELRHALHDYLYQRQYDNHREGRIILVTEPDDARYFAPFTTLHRHEASDEEKRDQLAYYQHQLDPTTPLDLEAIRQISQSAARFVTLKAALRQQLSGIKNNLWAGLSEPLPPSKIAEVVNLSDPDHQPDAVNQARLNAIQSTLQYSPFVFLAGKSGVGKTSFVEHVWKNEAAQRRLHIGVQALRAWANSRAPGTKALFIDEANLTQNQWSQFEGLFLNDPPGIMIDNEYVSLTSEHKVIFAGNPAHYSYDRNLPSLLSRHGNSVVFEQLPPAYIYHALLLPLFGDDASDAEEICTPFLQLYLDVNRLNTDSVLLTSRELIMMTQLTLNYCKTHPETSPERVAYAYRYHLSRPFVPANHVDNFDSQYRPREPLQRAALRLSDDCPLTLNASNQPIVEMLSDFLSLREAYISNPMTGLSPGLGGIIIEGAPGLGKSELAIACLTAQSFTKRSIDATAPPVNQRYFYHLPAGAEPTVKHALLKRAFEEGAVVLCDEINATASQEELLNRLLMGKNLDGNAAHKPGFMLIGTQNPSTMPERRKTSLAELHRMHYRVLPHYNQEEMFRILRHRGLPERRIQAIIEQYLAQSKSDKSLCFRNVINAVDNDLKALLGKEPSEISVENLLSLAKTHDAHADQLEAIYRHKQCNDEVKLALAQHPQLNAAVFDDIWDSQGKAGRLRLMNHPRCTTVHVKSLISASRDSVEQLREIARLSTADEACLIALLRQSQDLSERIYHHPHCSDAVLAEMVQHSQHVDHLTAALWHPQSGQQTVFAMLGKISINDHALFSSLLMHKDCDEDDMTQIASKTYHADVILKIINHPKCTLTHLLEIDVTRLTAPEVLHSLRAKMLAQLSAIKPEEKMEPMMLLQSTHLIQTLRILAREKALPLSEIHAELLKQIALSPETSRVLKIEILHFTLQSSPPTTVTESKFCFFSSTVCTHYPAAAIQIMLQLLVEPYQEIDGKHLGHLKLLIESTRNETDHEQMMSTIDKLIYSGDIGMRGGSGRLRQSLIKLSEHIKIGKPVSVEDILHPIVKNRPSPVSNVTNPVSIATQYR